MSVCHQQVLFVRRKLHAGDLLDVLGNHDEVHLTDIGFVSSVFINITNCNVVTYIEKFKLVHDRKIRRQLHIHMG